MAIEQLGAERCGGLCTVPWRIAADAAAARLSRLQSLVWLRITSGDRAARALSKFPPSFSRPLCSLPRGNYPST
jgi:hypothetical protein